MSGHGVEDVLWDDEPPKDRTPYIPIISPKPMAPVLLTIVNDKMEGVWTHFLYNRTKPCIGADKGCEGCQKGLARRWKGYFGCWMESVGRYVLGEVTEQAARDNAALLKGTGVSFRGKVLYIARTGKARNSAVKVEIRTGSRKDSELPAPFDVRKALMRIWERRPEDLREERERKKDDDEEGEAEVA